MSGTVGYSTAYKTASLLISAFIFLPSIFIIIIGGESILFGLSLLLIDIPFILWTVHSFMFRLTFDSDIITVKSAFKRYMEYSIDEIITYHYNKVSHYGGTMLIIKTKKGKIFISSDCENMDEFRNFLITHCPQCVK